jgi:acyl-CoA thioesterase I
MTMTGRIGENAIVLFQGDSITEAGRSPENGDFGIGYAYMSRAWFLSRFPGLGVTFYNRGVSGNCVHNLLERWQKDCIDLNPTWVSILVGINDVYANTPIADFESQYRTLLSETVEKLNPQLVICEPFFLPVSPDIASRRPELDEKIEVVRKLAREFQTIYVALDGQFAEAAVKREPDFWAPDGVHPTPPGHALIAENWLGAAGYAR